METILQKTALKNEQAALTAQTTALKTQHVMLYNADGTPNGKAPLSTQAVIDLKTGKTLADILDYQKPYVDTDLYVDMGLPSGVLWAKANIDITTDSGFQEVDGAVSPFKYEGSFFSWGNIDGHNPISNSAFDYNWGGVNETEPYYEGQPYGSTPGNALTADFGPSFDAARANLGAPWRMPTNTEFAELFANIIYIDANGNEVDTTATDKRVTVNGVMGLYIQSKINGARLFFSCSGDGAGRSWGGRGSGGLYWSSTWSSARYARGLSFRSGGVVPQYGVNRYYGFALRPVQ
jgi:hypothetical protein